MMNFPRCCLMTNEVMQKLQPHTNLANRWMAHAPGLRGADAMKYIDAGISTDHECFTKKKPQTNSDLVWKFDSVKEALQKNFEALIDLMHEHYENMMFCSDDKASRQSGTRSY